MNNRRLWHHNALGTSVMRDTGTNGTVTIRRNPEGGVDITIRHATPFGRSLVTGETSYVYVITHTRHWSATNA